MCITGIPVIALNNYAILNQRTFQDNSNQDRIKNSHLNSATPLPQEILYLDNN